MPIIPSGVIAIWPSTNASIPSGWTRTTGLDSRHPKGSAAATNPDVTGGAATHVHTGTAHSHTIGSHTHANGVLADSTNSTMNQVAGDLATAIHNHSITGSSGSNTGTTGTTSVSWPSATNEPPYYEVIFIQSDGTATGIPDGAWVYWDGASLPGSGSWSQPAAPKAKYLRGAAAAADAGGTGGSSGHTHADAGHTHTSNHTHTGGTSNSTTPGHVPASGSGALTYANGAHTHTYSLASSGSALSGAAGTTGSTAYEPTYRQVGVIQQDDSSPDAVVGIICMWLGLLSNIPAGWVLCDGTSSTPDLRGKFVKVATTLGSSTTGGSDGHSHSSPSGHSHTDHQHGYVASDHSAISSGVNGPSGTGATSTLSIHEGTSGLSTTATGSTASDAPTTSDTQPPFRTVAFIMLSDVLDITVTSPTDGGTVTEPGFDVTWTFGGGETQQSYRVRIYADAARSTLVYDSGVTASATLSHTMPTSGVLTNLTTYYLVVDATDTLGVAGQSDLVSFTTGWTPPATITGLATRVFSEENPQPW